MYVCMCVVTERAQLKAKKTPKRESRMYKAWNDKTGVYNDCYKERWSDGATHFLRSYRYSSS